MNAILVSMLLMTAAQADVSVSHRRVDAADGAALALYRYQTDATQNGRPVVLFADFGFGRSLFAGGEAPLTAFLNARGFRVYVAQVRGQGAAEAFDSLQNVERFDVPALIRAVNAEAGEVDVIAHGWLGALVLAASTDASLKIRRVVAANAPVAAEVPSVLVERFLESGGAFSALALTENGVHDFETMMALWSRMGSRELRAMARSGMRDLGPKLSAQLLSWMRSGDLPLRDGLKFSEVISRYEKPTLVLAGLADGFANPEFAVPLRELSRAAVHVHVFTRVENSEDYSHLSLFQGKRAPSEVFDSIAEFLSAESP